MVWQSRSPITRAGCSTYGSLGKVMHEHSEGDRQWDAIKGYWGNCKATKARHRKTQWGCSHTGDNTGRIDINWLMLVKCFEDGNSYISAWCYYYADNGYVEKSWRWGSSQNWLRDNFETKFWREEIASLEKRPFWRNTGITMLLLRAEQMSSNNGWSAQDSRFYQNYAAVNFCR